MFMKRGALEPELCHFYDGSAALDLACIAMIKNTEWHERT